MGCVMDKRHPDLAVSGEDVTAGIMLIHCVMASAHGELRRVKRRSQTVVAESRKVSGAAERPGETFAEQTVGKAVRNLDRAIPLPTSEIKRETTSIDIDRTNATENSNVESVKGLYDEWVKDLAAHCERNGLKAPPKAHLYAIFQRLQSAMLRDAEVQKTRDGIKKESAESGDGIKYYDYSSKEYVSEVQRVLYKALEDLGRVTDLFTGQRDKVIGAKVSGSANGVAFWSGVGAKAMAQANGHVTLEGSMASIFDGSGSYQGILHKFREREGPDSEALHWTNELPLWAALSEHYAEAVSEYAGIGKTEGKPPIYGYIGPPSTPSDIDNIYKAVESLRLTAEQKKRIQWRAVTGPAPGGWEYTGTGSNGRELALQKVTEAGLDEQGI